ncbi:sulfatase [Actinoplanes sp. KI2]|uniref:sulfatase-like hydrolase/transferase n=1 Tax=Actinoplanes sp. KI2 TaxID=2983315 RepID=UPI0021D56E05|nr:sulfatase-like hydrolase/transferase [Actinoplanes sp. KI2]MCU7725497.1 sulfatase [Actinoplanes sp. KI2]
MSQIKPHLRRVGGAVVTTLAVLLVFVSLVMPDQITRLAPGNFWLNALVRIPIEAIVAIAVLLALPERGRRILATILGFTLGLLTIVKIVDIGFFAVLAREFDPVLDWVLFSDGYHFLEDSIGKAGAFGVAVAAVLLAASLLTFTTLAVRRVTRLLAAHARPTRHAVFAFASAWVILAVLGVQIVGGIPVAAQAAADLAHDTALKVPQDIADQKAFEREVQVDAFRALPDDQLLTALRGKDVVIGFVESYGRSAVENPEFDGKVLAQLKADDAKLASKGFAARTGFLTSSTAGGGSWLAHSTFLSGLWIDNQQRYRSLVNSDRLTLTKAFKRAGYRTVGVEPGVTYAWPEGQFYGYDQVYDVHSLDYHGPMLSWSTMPDQYAVRQFANFEYGKPHRGPLLGEITLTSSHTPWAPLPVTLPWDQLGDGSVYGPIIKSAEGAGSVWKDNHKVRQAYATSIAYSVDTLISYVQNYADDNLVLIFLGDHQPASVVVGQNASKDVPISIVAKDPKVFDRIASWGWTDGLTPAPNAPVWPMNQFRDKFLTAFSPEGEAH